VFHQSNTFTVSTVWLALWGRALLCNKMTSFRNLPPHLDLIVDLVSFVIHHNSSNC
jgi:hypothetical protein